MADHGQAAQQGDSAAHRLAESHGFAEQPPGADGHRNRIQRNHQRAATSGHVLHAHQKADVVEIDATDCQRQHLEHLAAADGR